MRFLWLFFNSLTGWFLLVSLQLPRLYSVYKEMGVVECFETILENVFTPLFEVSVDPSTHPELHVLLTLVSEFLKTSLASFLTFSI